MGTRSQRTPWADDLMWKHFGPRLPDTIDYDPEEFNRLNVAKSLSSPGPVRTQPFGESLNERNLEFTEGGQSKLAGRLLHKANVPTPLNPPKPPETLDRRVGIFSDAANPSPSSIHPATMAEMPLKRTASPEQNQHSAKHQKMDVEAAEVMPPPPLPSAPPTLAPIAEVSEQEVEEDAAKTEQLSPMGDIPPDDQLPETTPGQPDEPDAEPEDLEAKNEAEAERRLYLQAEYGNDPVPDTAELPEDDDLPEEPVDRMDLEEPAQPEDGMQEDDNEDAEEPEQPKARSPSPSPPPTPPPAQKQKKPTTTPRPTPAKIVLPPEPEDDDDLPPEEDVVPRKPQPVPARPAPPKPKKKTVARRPPTPEPSEELEEDDDGLDEENSDNEDSGMDMVDDEVNTDISDEEPSDAIDLDDSLEEDRPRRKGQKGKELPPVHQSYEQRNAAEIQKLMDKEAEKGKPAKGTAKPKKRRVELVGATAETDPLPSILGRPAATPTAAPKAAATKKPKLDTRLLANLAKLEAATMTRTISWSDLYRTDAQMEEIHPDVVSGFRRTWDDAVCRALNRSYREVKQGKYHDQGVDFEREILELTKPRVFKSTEDPVHMYQQLCWYYKDIDFEIPENFTETCPCIITWSSPRETDTPIFTAPRIRRRIYCRYIGAVANCVNAIRPWQFCLIKANRMVDQIRGQILEISRERVYSELSPWEGCGKNQFREWLNAWVFAEWNLYFFK